MKKTAMSASVPDAFASAFFRAQRYVDQYFRSREENPRQGLIRFSGERYILVRAASMSKEFFDMVTSLYGDRSSKEARSVAFGLLFDIAHAIGKADARSFSSKMEVSAPIERLSAGPIHFAHTGWAFVEILPESHPTPDEDYLLVYDHPFSFEANAWLESAERTDFPVCIMNAGYSSGWCEESFGITLVAAEIECRAKGDERCRFIMAPPATIERQIAEYGILSHRQPARFGTVDVPEFFRRKRLEDELLRSEETVQALLNAPKDRALLLDGKGNILALNQNAALAFHKEVHELLGKNAFDLFPPEIAEDRKRFHEQVVRSGKSIRYEDERDGRWMDTTVDPVHDAQGKVEKVAVVSRDMTDHKRMEEELRKHQDHLEELVQSRAEKLISINEQLQREIAERNQAEKALRKSETMLRAIFDQTFQFIAVLKLDGTVLKVNRTALSFVRATESEIVGKPFWETPWWTHSEMEQRRLQKAVDDASRGRLVRFEIPYTTHEGSAMEMDFSMKPVRDETGQTVLLIAEARDISDLKKAMVGLRNRERQLESQSRELEEANIALKVLLKQMQEKKNDEREHILSNVKQLVMPYLERLKRASPDREQRAIVRTLETNLRNITSPLVGKLSSSFLGLTPMEIRVANLVREGLMNKEIADLLGTSVNTISSHRYKLRSKLGLKNGGTNLRSFLLSLE